MSRLAYDLFSSTHSCEIGIHQNLCEAASCYLTETKDISQKFFGLVLLLISNRDRKPISMASLVGV
jgi:hypothetical protein